MNNLKDLNFLPAPRSVRRDEDLCILPARTSIVLHASEAGVIFPIAQRLQHALSDQAAVTAEIRASGAGLASDEFGIQLVLDPQQEGHEQGYQLQVTSKAITLTARTPVGLFYAVCTLIQLLQQRGRALPCLAILDWPDVAARGVMLDISRDKVPTMETLFQLIDLLASWKINQFQLYTEHTFAYRAHQEVWGKSSPMTGEEILELDAYCRERFVELVPNQNTFGHMHRWLIHPTYAPLAETSGNFPVPWGTMEGPFSLAPVQPGSLALVEDLLKELLPHFSSRMVNIGCDETFDVGQGQSQEACQERGLGQVYLEYVLKVRDIAQRQGRITQFWSDILNDYPELFKELPRDMIALEWGYEDSHPFAERSERLAAAGMSFYVCPGTSSWNTLAGRVDNALANLRNAAEAAQTYGAIGYLNTDWGDNGHWQPLPISYPGYAAGAAYSWCLASNSESDIPALTGRYAFQDEQGEMGQLVARLGNLYQLFERISNSTPHFWAMRRSLAELKDNPLFPIQTFIQADEQLLEIERELVSIRLQSSDAALIVQEYELVCRLMHHASLRVQLAHDPTNADLLESARKDVQSLLGDFRQVWLARNREGGLADSIAPLEKMLTEEYR
ncbi:beta-N-acetylhexosaminidase [Ktedonobacter racemifer]|uniref:beta-N-acetylhexosaminidase n=1 Tax=Ktedonobacter racemifer DSM 44963 TaxID=485913 RepID=D6TTH0_KTERA|nr:family 20 glycosylhydrolase [Ktedonobacter racemifer]EFH83721.1 Glycoside hydrolase, family 20, catalytic core [Ktedonobacter racemifer DSM 44963]